MNKIPEGELTVRKVLVFSIYLIFFGITASGQEFIWKAGNFGFFDNREYFNNYVQPQTMFGSQIFGEAGFKVDKQSSFSAGTNFLYEMGSNPSAKNAKLILYYKYQTENFKLLLGSFARARLYKLHPVLEHDTFQYYRPLHEGIFMEGRKSWGSQSLWLDWTSRQTETDRETFLIGGTGILNPGNWFLRYDGLMYHHAGTAAHDTNDHIRDNGGLVFMGGYDFTSLTDFDTLVISTGITGSYDRLRNVYDLDIRLGNLWELYAIYKGFGIKSNLYWGEGQTQMVGDGMYKAKFYDRTDLVWEFLRKGPVRGEVMFSLHFLPEVVDYSQSLTVYLDINGHKKLNKLQQ